MPQRRYLLSRAVAALLALLAPLTARALTANQVAVIANQNSPSSLLVAHHYLAARQIPQENLITVNVDPGEQISEYLFRVRIAAQVRAQLQQRHLDQRIKCLVTTYDVPLRMEGQKPTRREEAELAIRRVALTAALRDLQQATARYTTLAQGPPVSQPASQAASQAAPSQPAAPPPLPAFPELMKALQQAQAAAIAHVNSLPASARGAAFQALFDLQEQVWGRAGVLASVHLNPDASNQTDGARQLAALRQAVKDQEARLQTLLQARATPQTRDDILAVRTDLQGQVGRAAELERLVSGFEHRDSGASVDNELMMLWAGDYPREGRLPNPLCIDYRLNPDAPRPRVFMVSRLDGSTPQRVLEMINTTLKTEKTGLAGTAYFDARGNHGSDAYAAYDTRIRDAAAYLQANTKLPVVLDDLPGLFKAENCPHAALYCGWYSVHNYQDSCQWLPGAVGFHVASFEMTSLHTPGEKGWVVNLLDRGFCGTLGPVAEPYLDAFPNPEEFFPLLISGLYTQGEVYLLTCPYVSWQIGYVGDPLYNPYRTHPLLTRQQIEQNPMLRRALEMLPPEGP